MGVDLKRLAEDEERVRLFGRIGRPNAHSDAIQNVLDALNYYRCLALHNEQELRRHECPVCGAIGLPQCSTVGCPDGGES